MYYNDVKEWWNRNKTLEYDSFSEEDKNIMNKHILISIWKIHN